MPQKNIKRLTNLRQTPTMPYMHPMVALTLLIIFGFLFNIPLGYIRQNYEKFSFGWYFYIHISIPLIVFLRVKAGFSWHYIPLTVGAAIGGQIVGGRLKRRKAKAMLTVADHEKPH